MSETPRLGEGTLKPTASVLDYQVPEAVIYSGRSFLQLDFSPLTSPEAPTVFRPYSLGPPSLRPQIVTLTPRQGRPGTPVTVSGSGFLPKDTTVHFGSITVEAAKVEVVSSTELIVPVPDGAQSGPLTVRTKYGTATSLVPFVVEGDSPAPAGQGDDQRSASAEATSLVTGRSVARLAEGPAIAVSGSGRELLAENLQGENADAVQRLRGEGVPLELYRTALGTQSVRLYRPTLPNGGPEPPDDPPPTQPVPPPARVTISITSPKSNETHRGPTTGVPLDIAGAYTAQGVVDVTVQVTVGAVEPVQATLGALGRWSVSTTTTQNGAVRIRAAITGLDEMERQVLASASVVVNIVQQPMESGDSKAPELEITSPAENAVIQPKPDASPQFPIPVPVAGTAPDVALPNEQPSGTKTVEVTVDGDPSSLREAKPGAAGNWSTWSLSEADAPRLSEGVHTITVRATDNKGNAVTRSRTVMVARAVPLETQLFLVEQYRLSSFLGNYGAGRTIRTLSLLPGEKLKISIRSYTRSSEEAKQASSVLDSFNTTSADEFQRSTQEEQSTKDNYEESFKYNVQGHVEATWGWGKASVDAGVSGGTNAAREEITKNIASATRKHAATASAKRDVSISTSRDVKLEAGTETTFDQEVENINVSRTLNFVFRQMNQEYITLLHLVDIRVGVVQVFDEDRTQLSYHEVTLPQLGLPQLGLPQDDGQAGGLLERLITDEYRNNVAAVIKHQLTHVLNYAGEEKQLAEECTLSDGSSYLRFKRQSDTWKEKPTDPDDSGKTVPGIVLHGEKHILRTDGVVCDAVLGQGDALDAYSQGLQQQAVKERDLANQLSALENEKLKMALEILNAKDAAAADVFSRLFPPVAATPVEPQPPQ